MSASSLVFRPRRCKPKKGDEVNISVEEFMEKLVMEENHRWFAFEADPSDVFHDYRLMTKISEPRERIIAAILKWRHDWYQERLWEKKHDKDRVFVETGGNSHGRIGYWMDDPTKEPQVLPWESQS